MIVYGDSLAQHRLNSELVIEYTDIQIDDGTPLDSGYIALQSETHPTDFRSIRLLNLKGCMDVEAENFKSYFIKMDQASCIY